MKFKTEEGIEEFKSQEVKEEKTSSFLSGTYGRSKVATIKEFRAWFEIKENGFKFKKLSLLALEYVLFPIKLTKHVTTPPMGKRGDKGFLLDDKAIELLPKHCKPLFLEDKAKYGTRIVYVNGGLLGLPSDSFRMIKRS